MFGMTLSLRTYAEIFGSLAIIVGLLWFVHHERDVGYQQRVAYEQKISALEDKLDQEKQTDAKAIVDAANAVYENMAHQPVPAARVVRLCDPATAAQQVPNAGAVSKPDGAGDLLVTVERPGESTGLEVTDLTRHYLDLADGQITALQAYIQACQKEGYCKATVPETVVTPSPPDEEMGPPKDLPTL